MLCKYYSNKRYLNTCNIVDVTLNIKDLTITNNGIKYNKKKILIKYEKRLQRKLSRQVKDKVYYKINTYNPGSQYIAILNIGIAN